MKRIPDKSIDMVLCDLPYGCTANKKDVRIPFDTLWSHYLRICKDNAAIVLFAQGLFYVDLINSNREMFRYDIVWDKVLKSGFLNAKKMPLRQHEQIAVFYKKLPTYNPQFSHGQPLHSKGILYKEKDMVINNYGKYSYVDDSRSGSEDKYPSSIITYQKPHPSSSQHPTEKPVALCEYLIHTFSNKGDTVLDNCIGSGTTIIACINTNRNYWGFEIDNDYYCTASDRISKLCSIPK